MILTYKYRLYTSKKNKHLHRMIDLSGYAWNHCIALHRRWYKLTGKHLNQYQLMKHLTKLKKTSRYGWMRNIPSQALQDIVQRIERSYQLFFRNLKAGTRTSPPRFRKVSKYRSYTLKQAGWKLLGDRRVQIGKIAYRYVNDRKLSREAKIKTVTIKRDRLNRMYICFTLEVKRPKAGPMTGKMAGFDFGLRDFLTVHDGERSYRVPSPCFFEQSVGEIRKASRALSSKQPGSNNRAKARKKLARVHEKVANRRRDFFFKLAHELTEAYDQLIFEDLNMKGIQRLWGRKIGDYGFAEFLKIVMHMAEKKGKIVELISRWYPSSKTCHGCGYINTFQSLGEDKWECPQCGLHLDRDENAAMNIYQVGASSCGGGDRRPVLAPAFAVDPRTPRL